MRARSRASASVAVCRLRVAVGVAADPAAEAKRHRCAGEAPPVLGEEPLGGVDEALLEEPVAVADLVDDLRPARPHLVRLPEHRDLGRERVGDVVALVEPGELRGDAHVRGEHSAARGFRRVSGEHEPQRHVRRRAVADLGERRRQRLARDALLTAVLAETADAVVLLGDVGELEVERERPQDARLPRQRQRLDRVAELVAPLSLPRGARQRADVLDVGEQALVLLLDEDATQQVAEQADVAAERLHSLRRRSSAPPSGRAGLLRVRLRRRTPTPGTHTRTKTRSRLPAKPHKSAETGMLRR